MWHACTCSDGKVVVRVHTADSNRIRLSMRHIKRVINVHAVVGSCRLLNELHSTPRHDDLVDSVLSRKRRRKVLHLLRVESLLLPILRVNELVRLVLLLRG